MSRFADPSAVGRLVLGACECPGTPHTEDWIELRTQLGAEDMVKLQDAGSFADRILVLVVRWNLLDHDGSEAPVDEDHVARLFVDAFPGLDDWITEHVRTSTLPNGFAARSRNTSRASGSSTRTTRKTG